MLTKLIKLAERGLIPDFLIRNGIKQLCTARLKMEKKLGQEMIEEKNQSWIKTLKNSPVALVPEKANEQHYEVPPSFFEYVLGPHMKYSSGFWPKENMNLENSEKEMLSLSCKRAEIQDGQSILELGCGWGSLTLYIAKKYPNSSITAVSNSADQKDFITKLCQNNSISNISVITSDMNSFSIDKQFDRIMSIEMFEHMRNYKKLLRLLSGFLHDDGKLFVHIFSHRYLTYPFEDNGPGDWMAREFFSGGMMPSHNLLLYFQNDLKIEESWRLSGSHYQKTSKQWLKRMDENQEKIIEVFSETYGNDYAHVWFQRWRIFFMSCEILFGYDNGDEWGLSHYRFKKQNNSYN